MAENNSTETKKKKTTFYKNYRKPAAKAGEISRPAQRVDIVAAALAQTAPSKKKPQKKTAQPGGVHIPAERDGEKQRGAHRREAQPTVSGEKKRKNTQPHRGARGARSTLTLTKYEGAGERKTVSNAAKARGKLRVISLGGLQEIGKNITLLEWGDDIIVIDCGMGFPDDDMLGVDLVIPDMTYLVKNREKVRGVLITHGHEDHIGGVPYLLKQLDVPVYGTRLTLGILRGKLEENKPEHEPRLFTVEAGDVVNLGVFSAEFIHVNHSIADACAIAIRTPVGLVYHSGDFKIDVSPIDGQIMDLARIGELGKEGVELLLCESTNAERHGYTPSERTVGSSLERIFMKYTGNRLIIATFSSNVHRVQQIIDASAAHGRKVAILGRSMVNVIGAARELGYMDCPDNLIIDVADIKRYKPEEVTLITTGSQGEPMSALYRIAFSEHDKVKLTSSDVVVLSASAIPGNEKLVGKIVNALVRNGVQVVNDSVEEVHVSGHACSEEIKLLMALLKPKYFMPIHGEDRHLYANKGIAEFMGIPQNHIFISEIGKVLEISASGAKFAGSVPAGKVIVDVADIGGIGAVVLRDRKHLAEDGLVVVVASVDTEAHSLVSGPDIISRGFVYVKESEELMDNARRVAAAAIDKAIGSRYVDFTEIKAQIKDALSRFIFKETKRNPMILPVIMDV